MISYSSPAKHSTKEIYKANATKTVAASLGSVIDSEELKGQALAYLAFPDTCSCQTVPTPAPPNHIARQRAERTSGVTERTSGVSVCCTVGSLCTISSSGLVA